MKKFKYIIQSFALAALLVVASCEKESEGVSRVTYYPDFTMAGEQTVVVTGGASYTDAGATAKENGVDIPVTTTVRGDYFPYSGSTVDATQMNRYIVTYTATNKDGFNGSVSREVYVVNNGDMVNSIEGLYSSTVVRNKVVSPQYQNMQYVMIRKVDANTYEISDAIGGYYDIGRSYGADYRATGGTIIATNIATNTFTFGPSFGVGAFGGEANFDSFSVDPTSKTINFQVSWDSGFTFVVTLTQVNL